MGRLRVAEVNAGTPRFLGSRENLLFLTEASDTGAFSIVGVNQGRFVIRENADGSDMVTLPIGLGEQTSLENALTAIADLRSNQNTFEIKR